METRQNPNYYSDAKNYSSKISFSGPGVACYYRFFEIFPIGLGLGWQWNAQDQHEDAIVKDHKGLVTYLYIGGDVINEDANSYAK